MVSNARLDLPEPESPVTTISLSRGISSEMFFRLWTRAPCTAMVVRALEAIWRFPQVEESQLLHRYVAPFGELNGSRGLSDESLVGQVFARRRHALHVEISAEIVLDLGRGPCFAHVSQVIDHGPEELRCALGQIVVHGIHGCLHVLP